MNRNVAGPVTHHGQILAQKRRSVEGIIMPEDPLLPPPAHAPALEDLHAGLHDVLRLIEIEHALLRGRLESLKADSEGARLLEGVMVLGAVLQQRMAGLLQICREIGRL